MYFDVATISYRIGLTTVCPIMAVVARSSTLPRIKVIPKSPALCRPGFLDIPERDDAACAISPEPGTGVLIGLVVGGDGPATSVLEACGAATVAWQRHRVALSLRKYDPADLLRRNASTRAARGFLILTHVSVRTAVLARESPPLRCRPGYDVVIGIVHGIFRATVAHLEIHGVVAGAIDEAMTVGLAGREARAHAGGEPLLAAVRHQDELAGHDVNELVLVRVPVAQRRRRARGQHGEVDPEVLQAEGVPQPLLAARCDPRLERLRVVGAGPRRHVGRVECRKLEFRFHPAISWQ